MGVRSNIIILLGSGRRPALLILKTSQILTLASLVPEMPRLPSSCRRHATVSILLIETKFPSSSMLFSGGLSPASNGGRRILPHGARTVTDGLGRHCVEACLGWLFCMRHHPSLLSVAVVHLRKSRGSGLTQNGRHWATATLLAYP